MKNFLIFLVLMVAAFSEAQVNKNDTIRTENHPTDSLSAIKTKSEVEVVAGIEKSNAAYQQPKFNPTKAGLYSAVLPGLGQYYNRKYWKIPVVWGGIGAGVGITLWQNKQYKRYRNAFVAEINGIPHEFSDRPWVTKEVLGRTQDQQKRYRDYWIAITGLVYVLNIVDAVVDAHLFEGRNDPDLAIAPTVIQNQYNLNESAAGISLMYKF